MSEFFKENQKVIIIVAIVVTILEIVAMVFLSKHYKKKFNIKIYGGGILAFFSEALMFVGIIDLINKSMVGVPFVLVGSIGLIIVAVYDIKKIGIKNGLILTLLQIILSFGSLFESTELLLRRDLRNNSYNFKTADDYYKTQENDNNQNK